MHLLENMKEKGLDSINIVAMLWNKTHSELEQVNVEDYYEEDN